MPRHRRLGPVAATGLLLGLLATGAGCQSASRGPTLSAPPALSSRPAPASSVIAAQSVVRWSVSPGRAPRAPAVTGRDVISAEGTLRLGPYGTVQVAGLTVEEARTAITNHVSRQVADPRVTLQVEPASGDRPLRRIFTQNEEPPLLDNDKGWQYVKKPNETGRLVPVAQGAAPSPDSAGQRVRQVSASDPETAPLPNVLVPQPVPAPCLGGPTDRMIPREMAQISLPAYVIDPPDILLVETRLGVKEQPITGQHLVRPDGTIGLGIYGSVHVAGRTVDQVREAVARQLVLRGIKDADPQNINVDVLAYNSKFYYVIMDGAGYGEQVVRLSITGSETVLDAISLAEGLPPQASKKRIWVARRTPMDGAGHSVLPVDWLSITKGGSTATNYQIMPGDRIYVGPDKLVRIDNGLAKVLNPIERLLGVTLLGSSVVNSIEGRGSGFGNGGR